MQIDQRAHTAAETAPPERYDFGRPAALSREHARALAGAFDAFARQWAVQLASKTRTRAHIAVERVTLETYDEYVATVPATTTLVVCAAEASDERAIVEFPVPTALSWIVKMLGGEVAGRVDDRALTAIEQALLRALLNETLGHLHGSLGVLLPNTFSVSAVQYNAAFAQIASAQDLVVVARFSLRFADRTESASVALPAASLLERLSRTASAPHAAPDPSVVRWHVEETPVEVTLRLSPRSMRPDEVLNLAVGDIIPLPHGQDRPLHLTVADQVVATAAIGANGARLACVVTSSDLSLSLAEELK
ncbi:flagellar motor switch protein FliM [Microbacterium sp. zg.Y1090]|uniref:flagellar motor switch protein FliM n=1 Tax=Microbacterium TaxID=33882 RepID=UPI00214AF09D|nr:MULTISPECIES: flagellar motor switch protein FliM [unclassified Microbacterium]MCR2813989.1 flagellar motor switch protein FliM [Microbacterium sp. zg.Y1084]MCR2819263.1 flagellar motor switch protein FliM [Microbacterium sp. zg.Y1090]MDL5487180.1 flagellar motor switch protein FliM [Microbacterium sp. zg-Y1211]WIM28245.1 flagellar motor switch protein FliM [Microbacterium sp. zg-Y1090]